MIRLSNLAFIIIQQHTHKNSKSVSCHKYICLPQPVKTLYESKILTNEMTRTTAIFFNFIHYMRARMCFIIGLYFIVTITSMNEATLKQTSKVSYTRKKSIKSTVKVHENDLEKTVKEMSTLYVNIHKAFCVNTIADFLLPFY